MAISKVLEKRLNALYAQYAQAAQAVRDAEAKKGEASAELLRLTEDAGDELATTQFKAKVVRGQRRSLSVEKLVKAGVKATVIEKCYDETPNQPYVLLTALGERK